MKDVGRALWVCGLMIVFATLLLFDPSVSTESSGYLPEKVVNLQKLQLQLIFVHIGLAAFLAGVGTNLAGELIERLDASRSDRNLLTPSDSAERPPLAGPTHPEVVHGADGRYHVGFKFFDTHEEASAFAEAQHSRT
ncbi:hypothetical protein P1X14_15860 [Sphingomonas sp. AOB5]|uniref:hypothetical protein n=1 Tax=Sphingomonas sp. AOB5 TaxID=3034017 RepID=UPI0023F77FC2|nr:hypothetical protein [Sphingomonas sp. AOB5]MDF7776733.1 hypothetical protein [Sphingomonas sp. AOB5]